MLCLANNFVKVDVVVVALSFKMMIPSEKNVIGMATQKFWNAFADYSGEKVFLFAILDAD
jgi:hypothetical protein